MSDGFIYGVQGMETPQNLPPTLVVFIFISLMCCIYAIVDIFRSSFTKLNKVIWLAVVLFAPFGIFIYLFIGRRFKPAKEKGVTGTARDPSPVTYERQASSVSGPKRSNSSFFVTLGLMAVFCVALYLKVVNSLGTEKAGIIILWALIVVGIVLAILQVMQMTRK